MSAFPIPRLIQDRDGCYSLDSDGGLTKRELFAAMAMQGLCSSIGDAPRDAGGWISRAAMRSTWLADALLAELAKEQP